MIYDLHVAAYQGDLKERVRGRDAVVLIAKHRECDNLRPQQLADWLSRSSLRRPETRPVLVDGRREFDQDDAMAAGFVFRAVGIGRQSSLDIVFAGR